MFGEVRRKTRREEGTMWYGSETWDRSHGSELERMLMKYNLVASSTICQPH